VHGFCGWHCALSCCQYFDTVEQVIRRGPHVKSCSNCVVICFDRITFSPISASPFVISLFLFVKIDLATDSGSEYDRDKKKIGFHFFLHV